MKEGEAIKPPSLALVICFLQQGSTSQTFHSLTKQSHQPEITYSNSWAYKGHFSLNSCTMALRSQVRRVQGKGDNKCRLFSAWRLQSSLPVFRSHHVGAVHNTETSQAPQEGVPTALGDQTHLEAAPFCCLNPRFEQRPLAITLNAFKTQHQQPRKNPLPPKPSQK